MHYKKYAQLPYEEKWNGFTLDYKYIEGFSPLFYETDGTHWDLDHDADNFLYDVIKNYWSYVFVSPETVYLNLLFELKDRADSKHREFIYNSEYYQSQTVDEFMVSILRGTRKEHPDETESYRLLDIREDIENRIFRFIPTLLREIIRVDYTYDGPIDKQSEFEDTPYNHALIREPGKYLYHYFNDQMVFDNYVQYITVPRLDPEVVNLLDSGVLLEPNDMKKYWTEDLDRVIDVVDKNYRGWWT